LDHFLKDLSERNGKEVLGVSKAARQAMTLYEWPGNIRELRNTVEAMLVLDADGILDVDDLPPEIARFANSVSNGQVVDVPAGADALVGRPLAEVERFYIERALELTEGKREEAATLLGIGERTLYRKIKDFGLKS
jgi:two-component system response regulator HydG